jgi:site-specific DNA-cytosine methylase
MNENKVRYAVLQPLTGGAYFACEHAVGHPAEFIISYPGFDAAKLNKRGELSDCGNEYHLIQYLKNHDRMVPYYQFDRKPFQVDDAIDARLLQEGHEVHPPEYSNIDLVFAVPVCSGLSSATLCASKDTIRARNSNMLFLARFALNTIKPKVYIFENAPRLVSSAGEGVRAELARIARDAGYSVIFYRTDTRLHDNCQLRPRTFVYFFRNDIAGKGAPVLGFENKRVSVEEFVNRIPKDATLQSTLGLPDICQPMIDYTKHLYGNEWRNKLNAPSIIYSLHKSNLLDEFCKWVNASDKYTDKVKARITRYIAHIHEKESRGLGYYVISPVIIKRDHVPSAMFKTIPFVMHYKEDRLYTIREWLSFMGMPYDFEVYGDIHKTFRQIGQNVPARTAEFIANEALRVINDWDNFERSTEQVMLFDNTRQIMKPFA